MVHGVGGKKKQGRHGGPPCFLHVLIFCFCIQYAVKPGPEG